MDCEAQVIAPIFMGSPTEINLCRLQDFVLHKFLIPGRPRPRVLCSHRASNSSPALTLILLRVKMRQWNDNCTQVTPALRSNPTTLLPWQLYNCLITIYTQKCIQKCTFKLLKKMLRLHFLLSLSQFHSPFFKRYLWFNLETFYLNGSSWPISSNLILSNPLQIGFPHFSLHQKLFTSTSTASSMTILTAHTLE